ALGAHIEVGRTGGPSIRGSFRRSISTTVETGAVGGRLDFTWGRLDACPLRFGGSRVDFRPCPFAALGEGRADGVGGGLSAQRGRPWASVGALGRVRARAGTLAGSFDLGLAFPINRESFVFTPSPRVWTIPALVPYAALSLGAAWLL